MNGTDLGRFDLTVPEMSVFSNEHTLESADENKVMAGPFGKSRNSMDYQNSKFETMSVFNRKKYSHNFE